MSTINAIIQELSQAGKSPSEICRILKARVSRAGVYKALKRLKETGSTLPKVRSTPSRTVRTQKLIKTTREKIRRNPKRSIRMLASEAGVSYGTMQNVLKKDLCLKPYKKTKVQLLSQATKTKRLARGKLLLEKLENGTQPPVLWTDEKLFTVKAVHNHQNDRIYAVHKEDIPLNELLMFRRQKPASVMVWGGVTSTGQKTPLIFIDEGVKVNQHVYLKMLKEKLVPLIDATFGEDGITLQQDGATSHTANIVQKWCKENMAGFWPKELWPPSSPDLNPMDFSIWSILEREACCSNHANIETLKVKLRSCWDKISPETIRAACSDVHNRLRRLVRAKGGYIEN
ncbi:uncharacterized protein LOC143040467 [Oratosquilla oratoria]|uniref:uncharacterized protein LOC143040467 n=1 Tax=Oratosquilla oratoria TaxID=337810 RepID=UPI003F76CEBC